MLSVELTIDPLRSEPISTSRILWLFLMPPFKDRMWAAGLKSGGIIVTTSVDSPEKVKEDLKVKNRIGVVDAVRLPGRFLAFPLPIQRCSGLCQGFGVGQEGIFPFSFEGTFWQNCRKEHFCFERAYQETILTQ